MPSLLAWSKSSSFRILDRILTPEDEEITPTMKLKRKLVHAKYADLIEDMYR